MQNRVIRLRDAPKYLGMDKNRFNAEVRPDVPEIHIGKRGKGFDRLDLDAWFDDYKQRRECPKQEQLGGTKLWQKRKTQVSIKEMAYGTSEKRFTEEQYRKALAQAT